MKQRILTAVIHLLSLSAISAAVDFLFNSFNTSDLLLVGDARIDSSVVRFTNDSSYYSIGRAFFPSRLHLSNGPNRTLSSFSTSFVFSILPKIPSRPGFGLAFVLSNSTSPPGAISGQYFGIFSNRIRQSPAQLLAVEFDTGQNPEFHDPDSNHVGIDLNFIQSAKTHSAGYYRNGSSGLEFVPLDMRSGKNIRAWIEFDGPRFQINVTIAAAEDPRPPRPLISYTDLHIANSVSPEMFVGFSASKVHRDVKSSNILLDGEMRGRLGDFGLAKMYERGAAPSSTRVVGTLGYLAPELAFAATPTAASDVYSFGVVVLEAACGRRPIERAARVEDEDWVLVEWVREMYAEGRLVEVAEEGMEFREEEMELLLKLGLACCHPQPEKRPAMSEVVALLLATEGLGKPATGSAPMSLSIGAAAD